MAKNSITYRKKRRNTLSLYRVRSALTYSKSSGAFRWRHRAGVAHGIDKRDFGKIAGSIDISTGYRRITIYGIKVYAHALAFFYVTGKWPKSQIDHKNLKKGDNRWKNIRAAKPHQNSSNGPVRTNNKIQVKGVSYKPKINRYIARITVKGERIYLGCFLDVGSAKAAYCKASTSFHGKFARHH